VVRLVDVPPKGGGTTPKRPCSESRPWRLFLNTDLPTSSRDSAPRETAADDCSSRGGEVATIHCRSPAIARDAAIRLRFQAALVCKYRGPEGAAWKATSAASTIPPRFMDPPEQRRYHSQPMLGSWRTPVVHDPVAAAPVIRRRVRESPRSNILVGGRPPEAPQAAAVPEVPERELGIAHDGQVPPSAARSRRRGDAASPDPGMHRHGMFLATADPLRWRHGRTS
jgi:hypothetical protein